MAFLFPIYITYFRKVSYIRNFYLFLIKMLIMKQDDVAWREMKRYFGLTNRDISEIIGSSKHTVDVATSPKYRRGLPKWAKLGIWVFNKMRKDGKAEIQD